MINRIKLEIKKKEVNYMIKYLSQYILNSESHGLIYFRIHSKNSGLARARLTASPIQEQPPGTLWQLHLQHSHR
jgi:hypothetical protein